MIHYDTLMSLSILSLSQCFVDEIPHSPGKKLLTWLQPCNSGCSSNLPVPATLTFHLARWKNLPLRPWDALRCGINGAKTRVIDGYLANSQKFGLYLNSDCGKTSQESLPSVNSSGEKRVEVIASSASCHVKRCRYNRLPSPPTSQHPCVRQWSQSAKTYRLLLGQDPMSREVSRSPGSAPQGPHKGSTSGCRAADFGLHVHRQRPSGAPGVALPSRGRLVAALTLDWGCYLHGSDKVFVGKCDIWWWFKHGSFNVIYISVFENYGQILDEKFMVLIAIPPWKKR